jgi:phosphoenolpyruvate carboxykinase (GTP)
VSRRRSACCRRRARWTRRVSNLSESDLDFLLTVDKDVWREEAALVPEHLNTFGEHTPKELWDEYRALVQRLG